MEEILNLLEKNKIIRFMINIFFIAPIFWLTYIISKIVYVNYTFNGISFKMLFKSETYIVLIIFSTLLFGSHLIESYIMPFFTRRKSLGESCRYDFEFKDFLNSLSLNMFGLSAKELDMYIKEDREEIMSYTYKIPTAILMYSFCVFNLNIYYNILALIIFLASIYLYISCFKVLVSCIKVINIEDKLLEEQTYDLTKY